VLGGGWRMDETVAVEESGGNLVNVYTRGGCARLTTEGMCLSSMRHDEWAQRAGETLRQGVEYIYVYND